MFEDMGLCACLAISDENRLFVLMVKKNPLEVCISQGKTLKKYWFKI